MLSILNMEYGLGSFDCLRFEKSRVELKETDKLPEADDETVLDKFAGAELYALNPHRSLLRPPGMITMTRE
jgi:hypothetical protein